SIADADKKRRDTYDVSREIQVAMLKTKTEMESGSGTAELLQSIQSKLAQNGTTTTMTKSNNNSIDTPTPPRTPRPANMNQRFEEFCRLLAYDQFLKTGGWLSPAAISTASVDVDGFKATDEEYLAGACMGVCRDLERYALGRATARDVDSVKAARNLVQEILDYLMRFDFRNGPLRRKYDGTKYALKTLETLLYELSVTGASDSGEPEAKRAKIEEFTESSSSSNKPTELLEDIRKRMEHRDALRENLIKKCRDSQKAAKQAIYALHRADFDKAQKLIQQCEDSIKTELMPIVEEEPPLRSGSFANVLEEYAEAKLFQVWLLGKDGGDASKGTLLLPGDFAIDLTPEEYLGGLCDLTGEVGRYAVQRGTARDYDGVRLCLEANSAICLAIQTLERAPGGINKKMDQLRRSVEKIERMTYEMSLSKAAGINKSTEVSDTVEKADDGE
ncbi:MAG: hypothetical protein SGILL_010269, partial [Bacillariaceae sp.]